MIGDKKGATSSKGVIPTGVIKVSLLAWAVAFASQVTAQESNFRNSVRSAFQDETGTIAEPDVTRDYLERTLEKPNLDTEIPAQAFRDEGPRISVRKFIFHRLVEYPEYGITKEVVEKLAEDLRVKYMKEDQIFASGFTRDNLEEVAAYLEKVGAQKNPRDMGLEELKELVAIIEHQNAMRGISYGDLEEITSELTAFYRRQGLFLAQVQIPAQDVEDGQVALSIQEGLLGQVHVEDNKHYTDDRLTKPFKNQMGDLVSHRKVEEGMYLLNDLPGLNITGYFTAGDNPGETALNLKVREEKKWRIAVRADNHGSRYTGDKRVFTSLDLLNPLGIGDQLTLGVLQSYDPGNSTYKQLNYNFPFFSPRTRLAFSADQNDFKLTSDSDPAINIIGLEGKNVSYGMKLDHKFRRSRDFNFSSSFGVADKESDITSKAPNFGGLEHVQSAELGFYVDAMGKRINMLNTANINFQYGNHLADVDEFRGETYSKVEVYTNSLFFIPLPLTDAESRLVFKTRFQYSEQSLPAFEQISIGGAGAVRAFTSRESSTDQGAVLSAEWYFDLPRMVNDYMQFAFTVDGAYGVINNYPERSDVKDELGNVIGTEVNDIDDDWVHIAGAGMLFKFNWDDNFAAQISVATPISAESSVEDVGEERDSIQVFADLTVFFD